MNASEERWKRLLIYGIMAFFWAGSCVITIVSSFKDYAFAKYVDENYTNTTTGIIKEIRVSGSGRTTFYYYYTSFEDSRKNKYVTVNQNRIYGPYKIGDALIVYYNPANPKESLAETNFDVYKYFIQSLWASVLTFCAAVIVTFRWFLLYGRDPSDEIFTRRDAFIGR